MLTGVIKEAIPVLVVRTILTPSAGFGVVLLVLITEDHPHLG
jgi:hypothetical protein